MDATSASFAALVFVLLLSWTKWISKSHLNLPPSPRALPIIGHIHHLVTSNTAPHVTLMKLSKRYGPLMLLQLGETPLVVVSSPKMAKEVLQTNDIVFASRFRLVSTDTLLYNSKSLGSVVYGQHWKDMRKMCTVELFANRRLETLTAVHEEELKELLGHVIFPAAMNDQLVSVRKSVRQSFFNSLTRILMSKTFLGSKVEEFGAEEASQFVQCLEDDMLAALDMSIGDFFPKLAWVDRLWRIPMLRRLHSKMDKFLQKTLVEHRMNGHTAGDIVDVLDSHYNVENEDYTKATILDLIVGGTDTTSTLVEWVLAELLNHPEAMAKVQSELESVVGMERLVRPSDLPNLDYFIAVIKETLRLHPPLPLNIRSNTCAVKVEGYDIPKDSLVFVNMYAIGRDSEVWKDPHVFYPERFNGSSIDVFGHDFELIPFGAGRRICVGLQFGLKSVQLTLANLLHGFEWKLPDGKAHHPLEILGATTYMADPLTVKVAPRLVKNLYV